MASTVSITFQGSLVGAKLSIAYVTASQQITTFEFENTPITIEVAKDTLISMAGYSPSIGMFSYPIVREQNLVELTPVFTKSAGSTYYVSYTSIAKEDITYTVLN